MGFVSAGPNRDRDAPEREGEVFALFVEPMSWGEGVGGLLLDGGLDHLRSLAVTDAKLWVHHKNERGRRFGEERGWSDCAEEREDDRGRFLRYGIHL